MKTGVTVWVMLEIGKARRRQIGATIRGMSPHRRADLTGRADAKAKGVKLGRKPILTSHQQREARERIASGEP